MTSGVVAAAVPLPGVDKRDALASTLAVTSTTAVLFGAGLSRAAGIRTGWEVTQELIRRIAVQHGVPAAELVERPEDWWAATRGGDPRYDQLLPELAPTDADRRHLLEPLVTRHRDSNELAVPGVAHSELAELARRRSVRVLITTNFDRLMENALDRAGVTYQVLHDPAQVRTSTPLVHAPVTLIKLHGDYGTGRLRNSETELGNYPRPWKTLLRRVFDEYGLLVVGWSGENDTALVEVMDRAVGRRYAWYWATHHGDLKDAARGLVQRHEAHEVDSTGADELLLDLVRRADRIGELQLHRSASRSTQNVSVGFSSRHLPWSSTPPLLARCSASFSTGGGLLRPIGPATRERIHAALVNAAPLADALTDVARLGHIWTDQPVNATADRAAWRLGPEQPQVVSALLDIIPEDGLTVSVYVGLDLAQQRAVDTVLWARILRAATVVAALDMRVALSAVLPPQASLTRVELNWQLVTELPGQGPETTRRPVPLSARLDLSALNVAQDETSDPFIGQYAELGDAMTSEADLAALVLEAIQLAALNGQSPDPRAGLISAADVLGLPDWQPV